jgi:hypothetical protein
MPAGQKVPTPAHAGFRRPQALREPEWGDVMIPPAKPCLSITRTKQMDCFNGLPEERSAGYSVYS